MAVTDLDIVRRSLLARRVTTLVTLLTVATAVALLLVLLSLKDGAARSFRTGAGNMHLVVSRDGAPLPAVLNNVFLTGTPRRPIAWDEYRDLAARYPFDWTVPIQVGDSFRGHPVVATVPEFFTRFSPAPSGGGWRLREGRFLEGDFEVVLGSRVAAAEGLAVGDAIALAHGFGPGAGVDAEDADALGPSMAPPPSPGTPDAGHGHGHTHGHGGADVIGADAAGHVHAEFPFVVVGILEATGGPHDRAAFTTLQSSWILHAHDRRLAASPAVRDTTAADLIAADRLITAVYARVATREGRMLGGGVQQVFDQLRRRGDLTVASPDAQVRALLQIVSNVDRVLLALVVVVMLSSGIAILLALTASTEQRRRQIAVLRVLGFTRGRILGLVLTESALVGLLGGVVGIVIGTGGTILVARVMQARTGLVLDPPLVSVWTLVVLTATIAMAALAGLAPAIRAYRIPVARHLAPLG